MMRRPAAVVLAVLALCTALVVPAAAVQRGVRVDAMPATTVVYVAGDSITDGRYAPDGAYAWWRDGYYVRVRDRICGMYCGTQVVKVAHGGGCLVAVVGCAGEPATSWFVPEVLEATPRPTTVILEIGINDLGGASDAAMTSAYVQLAQTAIDHGVTLLVGTLNPTCSTSAYWNAREAQRLRISQWIRDNFGPHAVEFSRVLAGAGGRLDPLYALGGCVAGTDALHPNAWGSLWMAEIAPLGQIT